MRYSIIIVRRVMLEIGSRQYPMWRFGELATMGVLMEETREK